MNERKRWFGVVALFVMVAAAACGGGGSGTLTKAAFIERADKLCAAANEELDALPEPQNVQELQSVLKTGVTRTRKLLSDLRALNEPEADQATVEQIYSLVEQSIAKFEEAVAAITSGSVGAANTIADQGQSLIEQANTASKAYGFKDCSE